MLELFGWDLGMGIGGALVLVVGAVVIGALAQYIGKVTSGFEWMFTGVAAAVGGWLGSEALAGLSTWGPLVDGLYLAPALIGAVVIGGVVDVVVRTLTGGTFVEPRPI